MPSLFGLAPGGACRAASVAGNAVRSYRTISTLPLLAQFGGVISVALSLGSPPADVIRHRVLRGARTFLDGLSPAAAIRPSDAEPLCQSAFDRRKCVQSGRVE
jgi:hypothetical protein